MARPRKSYPGWIYDEDRKLYINEETGKERKTHPSHNATNVKWSKENGRVLVNVQLTIEERDLLKAIAEAEGTSVAGLIKKYILERT